ncbi:hypothetical protein Tco_1299616, partial [Tanacetum coccineum]
MHLGDVLEGGGVSSKSTLIASSSSMPSFTKGDVLEGGGVPLNVTLSDSLIS